MKRIIYILLLSIRLLGFSQSLLAQSYYAESSSPDEYRRPSSALYLLPNVYPGVIMGTDTVACMWLNDFIKYSPVKYWSAGQRAGYSRLLRDVRKTLPYAKEIAAIIIETYEYMETLPDEESRQKHLEAMERELKREYTPKMKKLTRSQGQLLMKLVDRETNSSSYYIVESFMGTFKAFTYNAFASLFGNSLKKRYEPFGEDRLTERACVMVEQGSV